LRTPETEDKTRGGLSTSKRVHSVAAILKERNFLGSVEGAGSSHPFVYSPSTALVVDHKLVLSGRFTLTQARGTPFVDDLRATLVATQGGVGAAPSRRRSLGEHPAPRTEEAEANEVPKVPASELPPVQSTGRNAFVGVAYFLLQPIDGRALGLGLDLSRVQLNARFAPTDETARRLTWVFSDMVAALYGETPDDEAASRSLKEVNQILKGEATAASGSWGEGEALREEFV